MFLIKFKNYSINKKLFYNLKYFDYTIYNNFLVFSIISIFVMLSLMLKKEIQDNTFEKNVKCKEFS